MKKILAIFVIGMALVGCKDDKVVQTKQWYIEHDAEREARVKVCNNDAQERMTADCQNAADAQASVFAFGKDINDNRSPTLKY